MASRYETILADHVLARMTAGSNIVSDMSRVRRAHRTLLPRSATDTDKSRAIHVVDGPDEPKKGVGNQSCAWRYGQFTISLFARSDLGPTVLDDLKVEVTRRLNPETQAYPTGVVVTPGRITIDTEVADEDVVRVDMDFDCLYSVSGEWSL